MRVFVSGQIQDKQATREAHLQLEKAGCTITHDWTRTDDIRSIAKNSSESASRAEKDIRGVIDAELYVLMSNNELPGKGMYVELGAALALNQTTGLPRVVTIGKRNHPSIFYFHPAVEHFDSLDELIVEIENAKK
jgi:hypothetical protein